MLWLVAHVTIYNFGEEGGKDGHFGSDLSCDWYDNAMVQWMYEIACYYILYVAKLALAASKIETCLFIDSIIMTSLNFFFTL